MLVALTHVVSPHIGRCELSFLERSPINYDRAVEQHEEYCTVLRDCWLRVIELSVNRSYPDCTFIEDTAVVVDELAIMASMGAESRRGEVRGVESELTNYREITHIRLPATLDGGDVLRMGRKIFAGITPRTNMAGVESLKNILEPLGYQVIPVTVKGCLHLKSACTAIDNHTVLVNPDWLDLKPFADLRIISIPEGEPWAANSLQLNNTILMHAGFSKTVEAIQTLGFLVRTIDISELLKAEAGLTCSSIIFKHPV